MWGLGFWCLAECLYVLMTFVSADGSLTACLLLDISRFSMHSFAECRAAGHDG